MTVSRHQVHSFRRVSDSAARLTPVYALRRRRSHLPPAEQEGTTQVRTQIYTRCSIGYQRFAIKIFVQHHIFTGPDVPTTTIRSYRPPDAPVPITRTVPRRAPQTPTPRSGNIIQPALNPHARDPHRSRPGVRTRPASPRSVSEPRRRETTENIPVLTTLSGVKSRPTVTRARRAPPTRVLTSFCSVAPGCLPA